MAGASATSSIRPCSWFGGLPSSAHHAPRPCLHALSRASLPQRGHGLASAAAQGGVLSSAGERSDRAIRPRPPAPDAAPVQGGPLNGNIVPHRRQRRLKVAVDVDEVLGCFLASLNRYYHEHHGREFGVSDYFLYNFAEVWKVSQEESHETVHAFFKSRHFASGIEPMPGAFEVLQRLQEVVDLVVVTSRQHCIQEPTLDWVHKHFPQIFSSIHFGNHWALEGISQRKVDLCQSVSADVLIDDNPVYAEECSAAGVRVLLFDWEGSYPWAAAKHTKGANGLVTRVVNWEQAEREIMKLVAQHEVAEE